MERNRPDNIPPPQELTEEEAIFRQAYALWLERGMDPKEVGRQVLEAIKDDNLYIITHDWNRYIEQRMSNIISKKNPVPMEMPKDFLEIMEELMSKQ
jgi:DNA topoisomerase IA